ncbi:uncharacterized protein LOC135834261 [Planococcus citri]|uniref:uncharacterized protein LOC135834261 n=1 Tax=Planococcus citri TaxID=170843 RepID=UPI0031F81949
MLESVTNEENDLKIKLKQISTVIIETKLLGDRTWFGNEVHNFCEAPHVIAAKESYSRLLIDPQQYFYPVKELLQETSLIYHIRLYGLFNFKLLNLQKSEKETKFQFEARNLTARIVWNYVSDNAPSMKSETLDVQIEAIVLIGNFTENSNELRFFDECTLLLSPNQGNVEEQKTLTENLNKFVMPHVQFSLKSKYWYNVTIIQSQDRADSIQSVKDFQWMTYGFDQELLGDKTDLVMNSLRELILIFRQAFGRNLYEELFSQNQTKETSSRMTNLENSQISFRIFRTGNNMFLYTDDIECQPRKHLQVSSYLFITTT